MVVVPHSLDQFILRRIVRLTGVKAHSISRTGDESRAPLPHGKLPGGTADAFELSTKELGVFHGGITSDYPDRCAT